MRKLLIASAALALFAGPGMAQTTTKNPAPSAAPTSADRTPGTVGSERGNNANSVNGSNSAAGTYSGANAPSSTDAGRTSGGGGAGGGGAGGGGGGAGGGN